MSLIRCLLIGCTLAGVLCSSTLPAQRFGRNGIKKGDWKRSTDIPKGWHVLKSRRYTFQSNAPKDRVKKVSKHLNAAYKLYAKTFPSGRTPKKPFVVKVFKNRKQFIEYGAPPNAGAYYSWVDKEMVGYDTGKLDGEVTSGGVTGEESPAAARLRKLRSSRKMDMLGVFAHEGWHQYFHFVCASKVTFPSWCDEGIGEYFYTMRVRNKKFVLGAPNDYRLATIKRAIKTGREIPLDKMVTWGQREYYAQAGLAYAQGWSFVHFLLEHPKYKKKRYLARFVKVFLDQHSIEKAVERVFTKMDWKKITKDWKAWVMALKIEDPSAAKAPEPKKK